MIAQLTTSWIEITDTFFLTKRNIMSLLTDIIPDIFANHVSDVVLAFLRPKPIAFSSYNIQPHLLKPNIISLVAISYNMTKLNIVYKILISYQLNEN